MRLLKILSTALLCAALASCESASSPDAIARCDVCVFDANGYSLRVRRGENCFEFIAPEDVAGTIVSFDADGNCTLSAPGTTVGSESENGGAKYAVTAAIPDGRGYHDWLVLAYPEDFLPATALYADNSGEFEFDGAAFSISADGECSVVRGGLERSARRTDGE